jgi:hypothetical protein
MFGEHVIRGSVMIVVEWKSDPTSLIHTLSPRAPRFEITADDSAEDILERITALEKRATRVLFHFDLSEQRRLPRQRDWLVRKLQEGGMSAWNSKLTDISKDVVQRTNRELGLPHTQASRQGPKNELLIVKTRWNAFGFPELQLSESERKLLGYPRRWSRPIEAWDEYPVLRRVQIPPHWWQSRRLFIERFISNSQGDFYRAFFCGTQCALGVGRSHALVKRPESGSFPACYLLSRKRVTDPSGIRRMPRNAWTAFQTSCRFANTFALDYGAIDLIGDDSGSTYVVDVNPTPDGRSMHDKVRSYLRRGLSSGVY